jgi:5'-nucleotidase
MIAKNRMVGLGPVLLGVLVALSSCGSSDSPSGPLRILVTNDDGVGAEGIDLVVQALVEDSNNIVIVSAPKEETSGSADTTVAEDSPPAPECANGTGLGDPSATASGYESDVWAVDGCPADAVLFALENLYSDEPPHVVLSGINAGQNVGFISETIISQISGTVGAAKTAACSGVPALASSQGSAPAGGEIDYESGLQEVLRWLEDNRSALLAGDVPRDTITSINIPSCAPGTSIRGRVEVPLGTETPDFLEGQALPIAEQDCESTLEDPQDDLEAFFSGFVAITPVPSNSSGTCDGLN